MLSLVRFYNLHHLLHMVFLLIVRFLWLFWQLEQVPFHSRRLARARASVEYRHFYARYGAFQAPEGWAGAIDKAAVQSCAVGALVEDPSICLVVQYVVMFHMK
jgi:hypothetical protein